MIHFLLSLTPNLQGVRTANGADRCGAGTDPWGIIDVPRQNKPRQLSNTYTPLYIYLMSLFPNINLSVWASLGNNSIVSGWFYGLVQLQELQKPDMLDCFWKKKNPEKERERAEDIIYLSHVGCPSTHFYRSSSPFAPLKSSRFEAVILVHIPSCVF